MSRGKKKPTPGRAQPSSSGGQPDKAIAAVEVLAILEVLVKHGIDFVVIGGVAVVHHGVLRVTKDIDVIPAPSAENLRKLWPALEELEARPIALNHMRLDQLPVPFSAQSLYQGGSWDLETKHGRLDLLQYVVQKVESEADYQGLRERAEPNQQAFGTAWFVSYQDLLDFKNIAGRDQDMLDIRALEEARGSAGPK